MTLSKALSLRNPENTPSTMNVGTIRIRAKPARMSEFHSADMTYGRTGTFWTGRFSPVAGDEVARPGRIPHHEGSVGAELVVERGDVFWSRVLSQDGAPTLPGSTSASRKIRIDARISVGTMRSSRRPMRRNILGLYLTSSP